MTKRTRDADGWLLDPNDPHDPSTWIFWGVVVLLMMWAAGGPVELIRFVWGQLLLGM